MMSFLNEEIQASLWSRGLSILPNYSTSLAPKMDPTLQIGHHNIVELHLPLSLSMRIVQLRAWNEHPMVLQKQQI